MTPIPGLILYVLLFFFIGVAVFYCIDKHFKNRRIWIKNPRLRLNYSFHDWKVADYSAIAIIASIGLLLIILLLKFMGGKIPYIIPRAVFFIICASTIIFSISYYSLVNIYKKYSGLLKIAGTLAALTITLIADSMADETIAIYTHADPAKFPTAQKIFILVMVVALWVYLAMYAIFPAFFLVCSHIFKSQILEHFKQRKRSYADSCTNFKKNNVRDFNLGFASVLGLTYTSLILLGVIANTDSKFVDKTLKKILVSTSFHFPPEACKIETFYNESYVAFIDDDKVLLATPDRELGYTFQERKCEIQPVKIDRTPTKPIHRLLYKADEFNAPRAISPKSCPIQFCSIIDGNFCI
jgi:hypothetical protein